MTTVQLNTVTRRLEVFSSARDVQARAEIADHKAAADPHPQYLGPSNVADIATSGNAGDLIAGTVPDGRMPAWTGYTAPTKAALEAVNVPAAVDALSLLGYGAIGDGGGAPYKRAAAEPGHEHKIQSADGAWWEETFAVDVTVNIPSDFATLQEAIDRLSKQPVRQGVRVIINIESGHSPASGITVANGDYSRFKIASDDATVTIDPSFTGSLLYGSDARMPTLACLVDCNGVPVNRFIRVEDGSSLFIGSGAGAMNGASDVDNEGTGLFVYRGSQVAGSGIIVSGFANHNVWINHQSFAFLEAGDFTNAGVDGAFVSRACIFYAPGSNFSGAGAVGIHIRRAIAVAVPTAAVVNIGGCGVAGLHVEMGSMAVVSARSGVNPINVGSNQGVVCDTGSTAYIEGMEIENAAFDAIRCLDHSKVNAKNVVMTTIGRDALVCRNDSDIYAGDTTATGVVDRVIAGDEGSRIIAPRIIATGAGGTAVVVSGGAYADVSSGDLSNAAGTALEALNGGHILAISTTATGAGSRGLNCDNSRANVTNANLSGAVSAGIRAIGGAEVVAKNTNAQKGGSPVSTDVLVGEGSMVRFFGGTGGVNVATNTLASTGIVFR